MVGTTALALAGAGGLAAHALGAAHVQGRLAFVVDAAGDGQVRGAWPGTANPLLKAIGAQAAHAGESLSELGIVHRGDALQLDGAVWLIAEIAHAGGGHGLKTSVFAVSHFAANRQ